MFSILIPIYNRDVLPLVKNLYPVFCGKPFPFEIICADDASPKTDCLAALEAELEYMEEVRLIRLPQNVGRAQIRNLLAAEAQYEYCWFLDADMMPPYDMRYDNKADDVVDSYCFAIEHQRQKPFVLCGGHCYSALPPTDSRLYLHWWYGQHREVRLAVLRQKNPYRSFTTANFVISRSIFGLQQFETKIRSYGHEDTLFGLALQRLHIPFVHIHNPMEHLGLETFDVFIAKTRQGVENLFLLAKDIDLKPAPIQLWKAFRLIRWLRLRWLFALLFFFSQRFALWRLNRLRPNLRWLDWYKLCYLCKISYKK